jgi:hypothetical protein
VAEAWPAAVEEASIEATVEPPPVVTTPDPGTNEATITHPSTTAELSGPEQSAHIPAQSTTGEADASPAPTAETTEADAEATRVAASVAQS